MQIEVIGYFAYQHRDVIRVMDYQEKSNFYPVSLILITSVGMSILLSSYSIALFLGNFSRSTLPYYFIASGVISVLSMLLLLPFLKTTDKRAILIVQISSIVVIVLYLILDFWPSKLLALIYTFLFIVLSSIYGANSWNIAGASFELRVFKSFANQFLILTSLGSILLSIFAYAGIDIWGHHFLIYFSLLLMVANCVAVKKVQLQQVNFKSQVASVPLRTYPLFVNLAIFLALINIISIFTNYQMMFRLSEAFNMTHITKFMTLFYLFIYVGSFLTQLYSKRILELFGISVLFLSSTVFIFIFLIPSVFYPYLYSVALLNAIVTIFYSGLVSLGRQVALNALPSIVKNKGQILIKSITNNLARIFASFILLIFAYRYSFYSYQILTVVSIIFMLFFAWKIKQFYGETLLISIKGKRFYLPI